MRGIFVHRPGVRVDNMLQRALRPRHTSTMGTLNVIPPCKWPRTLRSRYTIQQDIAVCTQYYPLVRENCTVEHKLGWRYHRIWVTKLHTNSSTGDEYQLVFDPCGRPCWLLAVHPGAGGVQPAKECRCRSAPRSAGMFRLRR